MSPAALETVIHPTAVVLPGAELGSGVEVGPHCVVEPGAEVGDRCRLLPGAQLLGRVVLGADCVIGSGAVVGGPPQDTRYRGERTVVRMGRGCRLHEHATVHRATGEGEETVLGNEVMLMTGAHVGHNCRVAEGVNMVNYAALAGHAVVGERAFISAYAAVHQFGRVGRLTLVGGATQTTKDAPPFSIVTGSYPVVWRAPNTVGLRRAGIPGEERDAIRQALHAALARGDSPTEVARGLLDSPYASVVELANFILESKRGIAVAPTRP